VKSQRPISTCALCLQVTPLVQSHIVPDFLLKECEDWIEKGKSRQKQPHLTLVDYDTADEIYCQQKGNVLKKEGLREYLLCEDCEKRMKIGEDYARVCLYGAGPVKQHTRPAKSVRRYRTRRGKILREGYDVRWVDFEKFKRFQISVIWRACAAKGKAFKKAQASNSTMERMRLALLSGKFDEDLVPCAMELLEDPNRASVGIFAPPFGDRKIVFFIMGGYKWHFYVDGNAPIEIILRTSGFMLVKVSDIDCLYTPDETLNAP